MFLGTVVIANLLCYDHIFIRRQWPIPRSNNTALSLSKFQQGVNIPSQCLVTFELLLIGGKCQWLIMCKESAKKDQEKIADLAKRYEYNMTLKHSTTKSRFWQHWLYWIHFTQAWYEQKFLDPVVLRVHNEIWKTIEGEGFRLWH